MEWHLHAGMKRSCAGVERKDSCIYGHNNVAWNMALTSSRFEDAEDERVFGSWRLAWLGKTSQGIL